MPLETKRAEARKALMHLSYNQIGDEIGVTGNTVGRWFRGEVQPSAANLSQLAEVLKVSSDYLLGQTDDPTPPRKLTGELSSFERRLIAAYRSGDWKELMRLLGNDD